MDGKPNFTKATKMEEIYLIMRYWVRMPELQQCGGLSLPSIFTVGAEWEKL